MTIGILDLQGGVVEHLVHLKRLGVSPVLVKKISDLSDVTGLIIPGGESSSLSRLLGMYELDVAIRERFAAGMKIWGTCAGAILLAKDVDGESPHLALMDISIRRNAFGSQLDSFNTTAHIPEVADYPIPLTFIRAPKIIRIGQGVRPLLKLNADQSSVDRAKDGQFAETKTDPDANGHYFAAAEDDRILATIFHPELTPDSSFHRYFCHKCGIETRSEPTQIRWSQDSWTGLTGIP